MTQQQTVCNPVCLRACAGRVVGMQSDGSLKPLSPLPLSSPLVLTSPPLSRARWSRCFGKASVRNPVRDCVMGLRGLPSPPRWTLLPIDHDRPQLLAAGRLSQAVSSAFQSLTMDVTQDETQSGGVQREVGVLGQQAGTGALGHHARGPASAKSAKRSDDQDSLETGANSFVLLSALDRSARACSVVSISVAVIRSAGDSCKLVRLIAQSLGVRDLGLLRLCVLSCLVSSGDRSKRKKKGETYNRASGTKRDSGGGELAALRTVV